MSKISVTLDGHPYDIEVKAPHDPDALTVIVNGETVQVSVSSLADPAALEWIRVGTRVYELMVDHDLRWIQTAAGRHRLDVRDLEAVTTRPMSGDARVKAPVPGLITRVLVQQGDQVEAGQPLLVLEAMKMENEICAPRSGTVSRLDVSLGQGVTLNQVLAEIS